MFGLMEEVLEVLEEGEDHLASREVRVATRLGQWERMAGGFVSVSSTMVPAGGKERCCATTIDVAIHQQEGITVVVKFLLIRTKQVKSLRQLCLSATASALRWLPPSPFPSSSTSSTSPSSPSSSTSSPAVVLLTCLPLALAREVLALHWSRGRLATSPTCSNCARLLEGAEGGEDYEDEDDDDEEDYEDDEDDEDEEDNEGDEENENFNENEDVNENEGDEEN